VLLHLRHLPVPAVLVLILYLLEYLVQVVEVGRLIPQVILRLPAVVQVVVEKLMLRADLVTQVIIRP
jgi:hypothetical protein